ncbi:MAG: hypothetical protein AAFO94_10335 [Bacteroidota bacterium]
MEKEKKRFRIFAEWNGEYIGNLWGWKFSYFSLAIIVVLFLLLLLTRHINDGKVQSGESPTTPTTEQTE